MTTTLIGEATTTNDTTISLEIGWGGRWSEQRRRRRQQSARCRRQQRIAAQWRWTMDGMTWRWRRQSTGSGGNGLPMTTAMGSGESGWGRMTKATDESGGTMMASDKSGRRTMSSSDKSGQTRPASDKSGRRSHREQAADKASKQQERDGYSAAAAMTMTTMTCLNNNQQPTGVGGGGGSGGGEEAPGGTQTWLFKWTCPMYLPRKGRGLRTTTRH
jgi:hypothetical protein